MPKEQAAASALPYKQGVASSWVKVCVCVWGWHNLGRGRGTKGEALLQAGYAASPANISLGMRLKDTATCWDWPHKVEQSCVMPATRQLCVW